VVDVAGTTSIDGISNWSVGDWVIFNGTEWEQLHNSNSVLSVNGQTGVVQLTPSDIGLNIWAGSNAITGVGTITSGTWNASPISVAYGGTGLASLGSGFLLYGSGSNALSTLAPGSDGQVLKISGGIPVWGSDDTGVSGTTWGSITGTLSNQTDLQAALAALEPAISPGTNSQYWRGDKTWQTLDRSAVGLSNVENTALSTWPGSGNITTVGTINSGVWNGSPISIAKGGTGASSLSAAGIVTASCTNVVGQTDGNTNIKTITVPNDGSNHNYEISTYLNVTSLSLNTVTFQVTFTDVNNTTRTQNLLGVGLSLAPIASLGYIPMQSIQIYAKPNTNITLKTTVSGLGWQTYDAGGCILQLN